MELFGAMLILIGSSLVLTQWACSWAGGSPMTVGKGFFLIGLAVYWGHRLWEWAFPGGWIAF